MYNPGMGSAYLPIGEASHRAGVSIDTIRYYERRHLIKSKSRTVGGFRLFAPEVVERIRFIRQAKDLGFSLSEVRQILTDDAGIEECKRIRDLLTAKVRELDERIEHMKRFRKVLQNNLTECARELSEPGVEANCPVMVNIGQGCSSAAR